MTDPVVDLLEAVDVDDHEREVPLVALSPVHLARERLVEVAAIVEARERVEVGELAGLAEPAGVLDHRGNALRDLFEPAEVAVAEARFGVA